ncbi:MAG: winged helix-turn-helix transcriptional regulator [Flavobacteriales bacterium]|nr:winged helix-turn-helix transcriptional regulator [Flavobacteriales bacterium]
MKIDDAIQSKFQSPWHRAIVNVRYTSNYFATKQNKFMAEYGLSIAQFNILRILRGAKKSISVNDVKSRMVEKSPNTTRLMDKLFDKGLISRVRCESDRRVVFVEITVAGLTLLSEIDKEFNSDRSNMISSSLSQEEAQQLSDLLDKMRG